MKRYYICDIVGDGLSMATGFRPAIALYGANHVAVMPPDPATRPVCLVLVNAVNHLPWALDTRVRAMPDVSLDIKISAIGSVTNASMESTLTGSGFTKTWNSSDAYRDVIRSVGRQIEPEFDETNFDVAG